MRIFQQRINILFIIPSDERDEKKIDTNFIEIFQKYFKNFLNI